MKFDNIRRYVKRNPLMVVIGVVAIIFFSRSGFWQKPPKPCPQPIPHVVVKDMTAQQVVTNIQLNGHSSEARRVTLKAKTGGRIEKIVATKGQRVKKDQDLILLDPEDRPARLQEAKARLNQRTLEYNADKKLEAKNIRSQNTLAASTTEFESAKSALATIENEIADTHIKAPFDGILEETFVEAGDIVNPSDKIGTVIELNPLKILCDISEKDLARLTVGEEAQITFASLDDKQRVGKVTYIAKAAEPRTRTYRVEVIMDNPDMAIPAGLTARINFPTHKTNGYLISPATISLRDDGTIGVKTVEEGKVTFHPVVIQETQPEGLLVTGLPDRISLITTGGDFVVEGQTVKTTPQQNLENKGPSEKSS